MTMAHMRQPSMWKWANSSVGEPVPNTAFAHAFVVAIREWAARQSGFQRRMIIPTGNVEAEELRRVVLALMAAKADANARRTEGK
jgi:hypothetical protein